MIDLLFKAGATLSNGLVAIMLLGILVFVHEAGHFLVAKWNKVGVLEFAIGFGKKIWSRHIGETLYSVGLIPLGGYVRMIGDDPFSLPEEQDEELEPYQRELLSQRDRWFLSKGYLSKMSIVLAGPVFNLLFAVFLSIFSIYFFGKVELVDKAIIGDVVPGFPAAQAGLQSGDIVISINNESPKTWVELADAIATSGGSSLHMLVERRTDDTIKKELITVKGTLDSKDLMVLEGKEPDGRYKIGIVPKFERENATAPEALLYGTKQVYFISAMTVRGLWGMVRGAVSAKNIGGPILILQEASRTARKGMESVIDFMIFLSVSLAILNLLPIPVLDGGHLVLFTVEAIKGSPLNQRVQERARQCGVFIILMLMLFAFGNDLHRLVTGP
jgi:regulator of sigma E protease